MIKNLENEIWKDIKGLNGEYQVSNKGRIKSKERFVKFGKNTYRKVEEKILKSSDNGNGYKLVSLGKNNKAKKIHRLVAEAFIPNPDNLPCVNHKDENKANNTVENLEWCTQAYNLNYGTARERASKNRKCTKNNERSKEIIAMDFDGNIILKFPSIGEAHRKGYSLAGISFCCNHKRNTYKGMIWSFTSNG